MFALILRILRPCRHEWRGVANYYDKDTHAFLQLLRCCLCDAVVIREA